MAKKKLNVAVIGLGRMGLGVAERLAKAGQHVTAFDLNAAARAAAGKFGAKPVDRLADLPGAMTAPRVIWLMVPAGEVIDQILFDGPEALAPHLESGDIVIDGGNSHYPDSVRRAARLLNDRGVRMLDCGTSGGVLGEQIGYCMMVGGDEEAFRYCAPIFAALAIKDGYARVGPSGAGHYVKMVHNAIEYGVEQVIGEGFAIMDASPFKPDLARTAELWNHGSVIRSWLMELVNTALTRPDHFARIAPKVGGGSTGTWAVNEAARLGLKVPAIELSLRERQGRPQNEFAARLVAALRYEFGRHPFETIK